MNGATPQISRNAHLGLLRFPEIKFEVLFCDRWLLCVLLCNAMMFAKKITTRREPSFDFGFVESHLGER